MNRRRRRRDCHRGSCGRRGCQCRRRCSGRGRYRDRATTAHLRRITACIANCVGNLERLTCHGLPQRKCPRCRRRVQGVIAARRQRDATIIERPVREAVDHDARQAISNTVLLHGRQRHVQRLPTIVGSRNRIDTNRRLTGDGAIGRYRGRSRGRHQRRR